MSTMLSEHFTLDELILSQTAARLGLDNMPDANCLVNLRRLAATLEVVRAALGGAPILVSSGYRSPIVNRAVGGSVNSAHTKGLAVDFTAPSFGTVIATASAVASSAVDFDQIIFEFGRWVHLGLAEVGASARRELLSIGVAGTYFRGLRAS